MPGTVPPTNGAGGAANGEDTEMDDTNALPEDATEVLYIQNLNEKIKIDSKSHLCLVCLVGATGNGEREMT